MFALLVFARIFVLIILLFASDLNETGSNGWAIAITIPTIILNLAVTVIMAVSFGGIALNSFNADDILMVVIAAIMFLASFAKTSIDTGDEVVSC